MIRRVVTRKNHGIFLAAMISIVVLLIVLPPLFRLIAPGLLPWVSEITWTAGALLAIGLFAWRNAHAPLVPDTRLSATPEAVSGR